MRTVVRMERNVVFDRRRDDVEIVYQKDNLRLRSSKELENYHFINLHYGMSMNCFLYFNAISHFVFKLFYRAKTNISSLIQF